MRAFPFYSQHNRLLPLHPAPTLLLPCILAQNLPISLYRCYSGCVSQISCWGVDDKYTFSTQTDIQTICSDKYADSVHTHTHWQNAAREKSALCSHTGHSNVTHEVSFGHPLMKNGKILINVFMCPREGFLSASRVTPNFLTQPFVYF